MRIFVKVRTKARAEGVEEVDEGHFVVSVKGPPVEGKANEAIIDLLGRYFRVPKTRVHILRGAKSKNKVIEIEGVGHEGIRYYKAKTGWKRANP